MTRNSDDRGPNGQGADANSFTRAQFLRTLVKGAGGVIAADAGLGGLLMPSRAKGALYADGTTNAQTLSRGLQFQGKALSFRIYSPRYTGTPSGQKDVSATFLNSRYALTTYHGFSGVVGNITKLEVADGLNFFTNRGNVVAISDYILHPTHDLVILKFAKPFLASKNQVIGTAAVEDILDLAGYGSWGTPSSPGSRDGNLRAFDARVSDFLFYGSAPYFQSTKFGTGDLSGLKLNGRGMNGDSGGPVFNSRGELVGMIVAGSTSNTNTGNTTHLCLGEPSIKAWIEANTKIPKPEMQCVKTSTGFNVSWDENAIGWTLQKSADLKVWNDVGSTILGAGSYPYEGTRGQQFFRLKMP